MPPQPACFHRLYDSHKSVARTTDGTVLRDMFTGHAYGTWLRNVRRHRRRERQCVARRDKAPRRVTGCPAAHPCAGGRVPIPRVAAAVQASPFPWRIPAYRAIIVSQRHLTDCDCSVSDREKSVFLQGFPACRAEENGTFTSSHKLRLQPVDPDALTYTPAMSEQAGPRPSDPAQRAAARIADGFDDSNALFSDITRRARKRFERRDWR